MNKHLVVVISALILAACGSDDTASNVTTPLPPAPAANLPAKIVGTVTRLSADYKQVTVNGYNVNIANADVVYKQEKLDPKTIAVGMRLDLDNQGQEAKTVTIDPALVGEVSAVSTKDITVNGIQLTIESADQYNVGDWVAVNGYPTAVGDWQVDSINHFPSFAHAEIEGRVTGLDIDAQQFYLGSVLVDYSEAVVDGTLIEGIWVEVEGKQRGKMFFAYNVDVDNDTDDTQTSTEVTLEGTVTWVNQDKSQFELNNRSRVYVTTATRFEDGTRADLLEGKRLEVDLQLTQQGLWAKKIDFEKIIPDPSVPTPPNPPTPPSFGHKFELEGRAVLDANKQLTINGIKFIIDAGTRFEDGLTINNLSGRWVQIEGIELSAGQWLVKEIEPESRTHELELTGRVTNNSLWGYPARDSSLALYEGKWVNMDCMFDGTNIYRCSFDD
ncbi:MAG: DUF5666 domain-containing protein [Enterovibrio sp.]